MTLLGKTAGFILTAVISFPGVVAAAQNDFEIDLTELRSITQPKPAKQPLHKRESLTSAPETGNPVSSGQESIYVVQPGEHLFKILMQRYGLSDPAAERLIPEVMRLNNISSPKGLKVGQRLRIPLTPREGKSPDSTRAVTSKTGQKPGAKTLTTISVPPQRSTPPDEIGTISIVEAPLCELARTIPKKLGLLTPSRIEGKGIFRAENSDRSVTVACGLSRAEQYSYNRVVTLGHGKFLALEGNESIDRMVEQLAHSLNLAYQKHDPEKNTLPLTYTFAPFGNWPREVQMSILPALNSPKK